VNEIKHSPGLLLASLWWMSPFTHLSCRTTKSLSLRFCSSACHQFSFPCPSAWTCCRRSRP